MKIEGEAGELFAAAVGLCFGLMFGIMPTHHYTTEAWRSALLDDPATIAAETSMEYHRREIQRLRSK